MYVSQGTRTLKIFKQGIQTIEYLLRPIPQSLETYLLVLEVVRTKPKVPIIPVTIITTPDNANITIDGKKVDNRTKSHKLTEGKHNVIIEMPGYESRPETINVNSDNVYFNFRFPDPAGKLTDT